MTPGLQPLVPSEAQFPSLQNQTPHRIARSQRFPGYPERVPAPLRWSEVGPGYQPPHYTDPSVLAGPEWAESADFEEAVAARGEDRFPTYEPIELREGRPCNPRGPTGLRGRGKLGRWGANFAADPILFRSDPELGLMMIAIRRRDNGAWAIPGGMVDPGERVNQTLARELAEEALGKDARPEQSQQWEEALVELFEQEGVEVYRGYVDDFRNTDDAWLETSAFFLFLEESHRSRLGGWDLQLQAGDDAQAARWMPVARAELDRMHANHGEIVSAAVQLLQRRQAFTVMADASLRRG